MQFNEIFQWLKESPEAPVPAMDRLVLIPLKVSYMSWRLVRRPVLGKSRRDRMRFAKRFWIDKEHSLSFHFLRFLYRSFGMGEIKGGTHLLKIRVPKHGYQYFCRIEKGDFTL